MLIPPPPRAPVYSPDLSPIDKESAIWTFGGYPHTSHTNAEYALMAKCVSAGFDWIGAASIWTLERNLHNEIKRSAHTA